MIIGHNRHGQKLGGVGVPFFLGVAGSTSLHDVFRATIVAKLMYAAPAWSSACSAGDRAKLDAFVNRCRRLGYCSQNEPSLIS